MGEDWTVPGPPESQKPRVGTPSAREGSFLVSSCNLKPWAQGWGGWVGSAGLLTWLRRRVGGTQLLGRRSDAAFHLGSAPST